MNFYKYLIVSAALVVGGAAAHAAAPINVRSGGATDARSATRTAGRSENSVAKTISANVSRNARRGGAVISRAGTVQDSVITTSANPRSAVRATTYSGARGVTATSSARSTTNANIARSGAVMVGRSATPSFLSASRGGTARATAIFNDISKMGTGYAKCREAYATCMDQLCANANDTYRRCFCSSRFTGFRDTEYALDEAKNLLMKFEDNNLNAVDKTAAEVAAMYTATEGEAAIKNDTSGAAQMLAEIGDLLSGKKKNTSSTLSQSLGLVDVEFSDGIDDIWGDRGSSIFGRGSGVDLTELEGQELYNQANRQCLAIVGDSCENDAVLSMATSSYSILISQDCNAYEKSLNSKREAVEQTVRTAEKYLREARLEEYRSHNSADVNECIAKVRSALTQDTACGENYKRCLDYTGAYVSQTTGEVIYSTRLFQLQDLISLGGVDVNQDVLDQNPDFNNFLESRKTFATTALDSCRDISNTVWTEFKRTALIEIAQAQDEKIEEVKNSCVNTMKQCYDNITGQLKSFDTTTAKTSGALTAYASSEMCQEKVTACAALYGNTENCQFDATGKFTGDRDSCGLTSLLSFVDSVDEVRVAEGCASAIDSYVKDLCTPTTGDQGFPWNCRSLQPGTIPATTATADSLKGKNTIAENIARFALTTCSNPNATTKDLAALPELTMSQINSAFDEVTSLVQEQLSDTCELLDGIWMQQADYEQNKGTYNLRNAFYTSVYGKEKDGTTILGSSYGVCVESTDKVLCLSQNTSGEKAVATYDDVNKECNFTAEWYEAKCESLGGTYENDTCLVLE